MAATLSKTLARKRRQHRVRARISGSASRPRLAVFRSNAHIYAQLIDDETGTTLASAHDMRFSGTKSERARAVGAAIAKAAVEKKISTVVFDRGGFLYTGRVRELAEGARESGLQF